MIGPEPEPEPEHDPGPGQVLFAFVRHWSRRAALGDPGATEQGRLVLVTEAVHVLARRGSSPTVNAVAHEIGVDQSGASRLIRSAVAAGYLSLVTSPGDARRREASLTPAGRTLLAQAHRWQEKVFDELTDGWTDRRRADLALAMSELIERSLAREGPVPRVGGGHAARPGHDRT